MLLLSYFFIVATYPLRTNKNFKAILITSSATCHVLRLIFVQNIPSLLYLGD
ncbi:hypothetical protein WwAna1339 [Wolbachia endosymbiont of Drosophila ananassae]|nr:hypothetical protein WwAna1339 [Wolbachia endosymbiont of Drosophila ananassae]